MAYKDMFQRDYYGERLIEITKELTAHIWRGTKVEKIVHVDNWIKKASEILGVEKPSFRFDTSEESYLITGGGCYDKNTNTITLYKKFSFVTLMHEFAHHLQHYMHNSSDEEFARGWSVSLFYIVEPEKYQRAVENGTLHFS